MSGTVGDVAGDIVGGDKIQNFSISQRLDLSPETLGRLRQLLDRQGRSAPGDASTAAGAPFVGRREHFGSLIYKRDVADYIPFDAQATQLFVLAQTQTRDEIASQLGMSEADRTQLRSFYELCRSISLFDRFGRFTGVFLDNTPSAGHLSAPTSVHLAVTNACNFSCAHCFASAGKPYHDELTGAEVRRLVDEMAALGCFKLQLGGGEPLVRRDLPELVAYANACGVEVEISTNAAAATPEVVETLRAVRVSRFSVSMDAAGADAYDAVRGEPGAFALAREGIGRLKTLGAPIGLRCVGMKPYATEIAGVMRLADELGADGVTLRTVLPAGRAATRPDLLLDVAETNALWRDARGAQTGRAAWLDIPEQIPMHRRRVFEGFGCDCGHLNCYVDARGRVSGSGLLRDALPTGDLRRQTLKEIWDESPAFTALRGSPGNKLCGHCTEFRGCRGGCRASALLLGHDLRRPDANCAIAYKYEHRVRTRSTWTGLGGEALQARDLDPKAARPQALAEFRFGAPGGGSVDGTLDGAAARVGTPGIVLTPRIVVDLPPTPLPGAVRPRWPGPAPAWWTPGR